MKPRKKKKKPLLSRLFKDGKVRKKSRSQNGAAAGKGKAKAAKKAAREKAVPAARRLSPRERSINEIKQLMRVGEKDPERLALLLSNLLNSERARAQAEKENFEHLVWDIVHRGGEGEDDAPRTQD